MARGDMLVTNVAIGGTVEILNRKEFEGVSMTLDFTSVSPNAAGEYVVKAGTPIDADGIAVSATPWTGAVGILLHDVYKERPQGTILTEAYVHTTRAQTNCSLTYDAALITALNGAGCRIRFEEPIISTGSSTSST